MSFGFLILTIVFIIISAVMILIILVQRPQGGGLAGAFGGAGGGSTDTVFGGRVGDALTVMTVVAFLAYLGLAIGLNVVPIRPMAQVQPLAPTVTSVDGSTPPVITESGPPPGATPGAITPIQIDPTSPAPPATEPEGESTPPGGAADEQPDTGDLPPSTDTATEPVPTAPEED